MGRAAVLEYATTPLAMAREAREYLLANGGTAEELAKNAALIARYEGEKKAPVADTRIEEPTFPSGGNGNGHSQAKAPSKFASESQLKFIYALLLAKGGIDLSDETLEATRVSRTWLAGRTVREASEMIEKLKRQPDFVSAKTEAPAAPAKKAFGPEVHPGRYAVDGAIIRVSRGKLGTQWAGRTFLQREDNTSIRGAEAAALLARIAADPLKYAREYFDLTGRCSNCNRLLTNKTSIEEAMGPICSGRIGGGKPKSNESEGDMTTTANKRGLKAAAEQRTKKHAQQTALPPKGGVEKVEVPENANRYGRMQQKELLRVARDLGLEPPASAPKGKLLLAILQKERELRAIAEERSTESEPEETVEDRIRKAQEKKRQKRAAEDAEEAAKKAESEATSKSGEKARATRDYLAKHGWESAFSTAEGTSPAEDVIELTATRTVEGITEVLWVSWTKGTLTTTPMPSYTIGERTIKLRNVAELKRYSIRTAAEAKAEIARVAGNKFFKPRSAEPMRAKLPFDAEEATEAEILAALMGRSVAWHNRLREIPETARVGKDPRKIHFTEYAGERIFNFLCPQTGWRAFRLTALTKVSK